jgi:hypothetical protein
MLVHQGGYAAKSARPLIGFVFFCASVIFVVEPTNCYAQTRAVPTGHMAADALQQRGAQLSVEIDAVYKQLRASKSLKNTVNDGNDVSDIVLKYISLGMPLDDAEAILRAAGGKMEPTRQGHLVARIRMRDGFLDLKHTLAIELAGPAPGDLDVIRNVTATIYLAYVPNANNR